MQLFKPMVLCGRGPGAPRHRATNGYARPSDRDPDPFPFTGDAHVLQKRRIGTTVPNRCDFEVRFGHTVPEKYENVIEVALVRGPDQPLYR